jgi:1-deoxy-D-xylulose-5-phosphate synthase
LSGGFGETIHSIFSNKEIYSFGIKDEFITHATREKQLELCGLDVKTLNIKIEQIINNYKRVV